MNPHVPDNGAATNADSRADDAHDAWLDHALHHAPDASADAPAALSDAILRSARLAVAPTAPARRRSHLSPLASAWAWLARPPVAAGFGSVTVATLAGVLWWGRPLDAVLPGEPVAAPASASASVSASERQAKVDPASPTAVTSARVAVPTATPAPAMPLPPPSSTQQADKALPSAPRAGRAARPEAAPQAANNDAASTSSSDSTPTLPMPPPAASPAPSAIEAPPAATQALMDQRQRASRALTDDTLTRAIGAAAESARRGPSQANAGPNAATSALALVRPADAGHTALAALLAAVLREPDRWRWQRHTGSVEAQAMTPNLQRWLAEAERATALQWRPATAGAARLGPPALRLLRDGVLQATLSFGPGVLIETTGDAAPQTSTAALSAAATEALTKALDEATR